MSYNINSEPPICEECDLPMHPYAGQEGDEYVEGWGCDGCGWSEDTYRSGWDAPTIKPEIEAPKTKEDIIIEYLESLSKDTREITAIVNELRGKLYESV